MKKASKILLTIGAVWNLLLAIACVITSLVLCIVALARQAVPGNYYLFVSNIVESFGGELSPEAILWIAIGVYCLAMLSLFFVLFVIALVGTILAFNGKRAEKQGILIANIVFGVLLENWLVIPGAVLGIIALSIEKRKAEAPKAEPEVEEAEQK